MKRDDRGKSDDKVEGSSEAAAVSARALPDERRRRQVGGRELHTHHGASAEV